MNNTQKFDRTTANTSQSSDDWNAVFAPTLMNVDAWSALESKLSVLTGIGVATEQRLWSLGLRDWTALRKGFTALPRHRRRGVLADLDQVLAAYQARDVAFFARRLPRTEHWRIASAFPEQVLFLDIETTGLSLLYHQLTLVGWSVGDRYFAMSANDQSPGLARLMNDLNRHSVLVTYNGSHFDVPFLRHVFPNLPIPTVHVDLRHLGQRVGLSGGQKKIEIELGIHRGRRIASLSGEIAPSLWFRYQRGDKDSLVELLEYNHADVEGLKLLLAEMQGRADPEVSHPGWAASSFTEWREKDAIAGDEEVIVSFRGTRGPRIRLSELEAPPNLRVVGIDLSGGPARPTGWASLQGAAVQTMVLHSDHEIISRTLEANPTLISIDAPLSLPRGRVSVLDTDPGRAEFGIMRECERILRRRGVNTYPALIRSMQSLTARGIRLASEFRRMGIPVIESFPGAMQDVLGMPRKGMSLSELKLSLSDYGLKGSFTTDPVLHDEIDAISSAIVGQLFWADRFEALGNPDEDYLIVPVVKKQVALPERLISISGPVAAGKTTLATQLEALGFARTRFSEILAGLVGTSDRTELRRIGAEMHDSERQRWLGQSVWMKVADQPQAVVDGARYLEDLALLRERAGSRHTSVAVTAPANVRRQRFAERGDDESFDTANNDSGEQEANKLQALADVTFDNGGSLYDLREFAWRLAEGRD